MVSSIMGISPAVLLRWQPERSEVSLSLFVSWQIGHHPIFESMFFRSYLGAFYSIAQQINKVPPCIIQLSMNKSGGTILYYVLFAEESL